MRRIGRLFVLPVAVFLLALGLSFTTTQGGAYAYATDIKPVTIGKSLASAGSATRTVRIIAAGAPGGVAGMAVSSVVAGGILLYETQDIWVPWINDLMENGLQKTTAGGGCYRSGGWGASGNTLTGSAIGTGCPSYDRPQISATVQCTGVYGGSTSKTAQGAVANGTSSFSIPFADRCGSTPITQYTVTVKSGYTGVVGGTTTGSSAWSPATNTQTTDVECINALDDTVQNITGTEVGKPDRFGMPSCEAALGSNWHPKKATIKVGPSSTLQEEIAHIEDDSLTKYRDCFDPTSGSLICRVRVFVNGQPCSSSNDLCWDWQQAAREGEQVQCKFGPHVLPLTDCTYLGRQYRPDTETQTVTETKPDGSVDTGTVTPPATEPDSGAIPETGTNPGAVPEPAPGSDPQSSQCWGEGWSWNPVSWVYVPVKCALTWAFVPSDGFIDGKVGSVKSAWRATPPLVILDAVEDVADALTVPEQAAGCDGPALNIDNGLTGPMQLHPMSTCKPEVAHVAWLVRLGLTITVYVGAFGAAVYTIGSAFGLKIPLARGGDDE